MEREVLVKQIIELQRKIDRARRQYELDIWMNLPITIAQLKSLFFISNRGSTNLMHLAAALGVTPTNTTGIIDRLLKQGLVSRTENPQDRRMLVLRVTKKGEELLTKLREKRRSYWKDVLDSMNIDELTTLFQCLTSLSAANEVYEEKNR
ncbi:MAG: MarR family transcriptional regulator [Dehalococcoidales bacterium]|nr:MarR family transcriptional regulator [Dehalococcoidales bacterium]